MTLLDTDHLSVFTDERDPRHGPLNRRMETAAEQVACTIVSVEEVLRGWLAIIHRLRDVHRQLPAYSRLGQLFNVLSDWEIVLFDERAADLFADLRRQRIRIGTMDLKIASISLVYNALLVTTNLRDYSMVPELRCENWLRP
ncbi:MAG TPA: type II toxin-antitoxin system VapC family toxin [Gemmataceae bacterium]|jgi:tRNA(fMet)-specific endonuclease VapC|nr:type II toxin-antitoxin system VapC family toxin [Gemmataceae bacterium]